MTLWDMTPYCITVDGYGRCGWTHCVHYLRRHHKFQQQKNVTISMINVGLCGCEVGPADLLQGKNIDYKLRFKVVVALL